MVSHWQINVVWFDSGLSLVDTILYHPAVGTELNEMGFKIPYALDGGISQNFEKKSF